jgi:hypothetical protein
MVYLVRFTRKCLTLGFGLYIFAQKYGPRSGSDKQNRVKKTVMINLRTAEVRLYRHKGDAAAAANVHRNTLSAIKDRGVVGDWLVVIVEEE